MFSNRNNLGDNNIKRGKRPILLLILTTLSFAVLLTLTYIFPPDSRLEIGNWKIELVYAVLAVLFLFIFSLIAYLFRSKMHGCLIASFTIIYLLFRLNNLTHPFFLMLLLLLLLTLEFFVSHKK